MVISATTLWWRLKVYFVAIAQIVDTGMANFGCGGGLLLPNFLIRRAIGKLRACWAREARLGLLYSSKTNFWEMALQAALID
jgi:hypothetical protein